MLVCCSFRAIYRVASVQPVISTHSPVLQHPSPRLSSLPPPLPPHKYSSPLSPLPPAVLAFPTQCSIAASGEPSSQVAPPSYPPPQHHLHQQHPSLFPPASQSQTLPYSQFRSQAQTQTLCQGQPSTPEQNGILDWLRRLRLHKYYPVFKQLTMEEVGSLPNCSSHEQQRGGSLSS